MKEINQINLENKNKNFSQYFHKDEKDNNKVIKT